MMYFIINIYYNYNGKNKFVIELLWILLHKVLFFYFLEYQSK
jgi:hypothetical protein